ncbi:retrovirus-related pol polyprotein from transposon TNT 1-94 [Tanacetum coccineum]
MYRLKKALYRLKQAPRAWYDLLSKFLLSHKFSKGVVNPTLFTRKEGKDILMVQIYVDDIIFASSNPSLSYADADHDRCQDTRRSTSGSAKFLGDRSSAGWSSKMLKNSPAISSTKEGGYKCPIYHFIKEQVENGVIELYFVRTDYQLADIFTKALPKERFEFLLNKLGMKSISPEETLNGS